MAMTFGMTISPLKVSASSQMRFAWKIVAEKTQAMTMTRKP